MTDFVTKAGTKLPIMNLKGKPYLQVAHRIQWFREEKPDYSIETEVKNGGDKCLAKATIKDAGGRILATAHKTEDKGSFGDYVEKAETGAIGRALAYCGYGTQFCSEELEEGERLADAPVNKSRENLAPGFASRALEEAKRIQVGNAPSNNSAGVGAHQTNGAAQDQSNVPRNLASDKQIKMLRAKVKAAGMSWAEYHSILSAKYGFKNENQITWQKVNDLVKDIESYDPTPVESSRQDMGHAGEDIPLPDMMPSVEEELPF